MWERAMKHSEMLSLGLAVTLLACSSEPGTSPGTAAAGGGNLGAGGSAQVTQGGAHQGGASSSGAGGGTIAGSASSGAPSNGGVGGGGAGAANGGDTSMGGALGASGNAGQGGTSAMAGGGAEAGGAGGRGSAKGGSANGGGSNGGTSVGGAGKGGTAGGGASGGAGGASDSTSRVFSSCRFHFGTIDNLAKSGGSALIAELDFFTPGWMLGDSFDQAYVCEETKAGAPLQNLVPVVVAYVAASYAKRHFNLCDCNVGTCGANNDLCHQGAQRISENLTAIVNAYKSYSQGYANCFGTTRPIVFEMEPDFYQYTGSSQSKPWTPTQAGEIMSQLVNALKSSLPNARFSLDASPWVGENGTDNGAAWFRVFDLSLFTFVNTSGGGTSASSAKIRSANNMTWSGLNQTSGKPILADTGYGANGSSAGHDAAWDSAANINARIADGVTSIAQYNPSPNWASTIASIRGQLSTPKSCP